MNYKNILQLGFVLVAVAIVGGCSQTDKNSVDGSNFVAGAPGVARAIGDADREYVVLGKEALLLRMQQGRILSTSNANASGLLRRLASISVDGIPAAPEPSMVLGYPIGLLKEHQVFGGVITKVSDAKSEDLGMLKLSDLSPVHVRLAVAKTTETQYGLALLGCARDCGENSALAPLLTIPIVGVDEQQERLFLDLAAIGQELNLMEFLDPGGEYTQMDTKSSKTTAFDYSFSTLVFDVETTMVPKAGSTAKETVFTARWYLRLASAFSPAFESRGATDGVGFFMTERARTSRLQRFVLPTSEQAPVKYYVKNVPTAFRKSFSAAFDLWNDKFVGVLGRKLLTYEFIEESDPRHALLVPGDTRYNILEWDKANLAPYGGLGPSIANQFTGEILSANVLIQGPKIIEIYSKWMQVGHNVQELRAAGLHTEADLVLQKFRREQNAENRQPLKHALTLGKHLEFRIAAEVPSLSDPLFQRDDFDEIPSGFTFETYMDGYFQDMVAHELGHNLGLRHNFRGNLGAKPGLELDGVSRSVMEYLGRGFRHLDRIGPYDVMAIRYGYQGILPEVKNHFCTDGEGPDATHLTRSPECSNEDATVDPFSFFESRLRRGIELLTARGEAVPPMWSVADMDTEMAIALKGMVLYAATASTVGSWTNFVHGDRPSEPAAVRSYVLAKLRGQLCDPVLSSLVNPAAQANVADLRAKAVAIALPFQVFTESDLSCN